MGARDASPLYHEYVICVVNTQELMKNMVRVLEMLLQNSQNQLEEEQLKLKLVHNTLSNFSMYHIC